MFCCATVKPSCWVRSGRHELVCVCVRLRLGSAHSTDVDPKEALLEDMRDFAMPKQEGGLPRFPLKARL